MFIKMSASFFIFNNLNTHLEASFCISRPKICVGLRRKFSLKPRILRTPVPATVIVTVAEKHDSAQCRCYLHPRALCCCSLHPVNKSLNLGISCVRVCVRVCVCVCVSTLHIPGDKCINQPSSTHAGILRNRNAHKSTHAQPTALPRPPLLPSVVLAPVVPLKIRIQGQ